MVEEVRCATERTEKGRVGVCNCCGDVVCDSFLILLLADEG